MRRTLFFLFLTTAGILAVGLILAQAPPDSVSVVVNGHEAEGVVRVFAAGVAGTFAILILAVALLVAACLLAGVGALVGVLVGAAGLLLALAGLPLLAPFAVLLGIAYILLRRGQHVHDAA